MIERWSMSFSPTQRGEKRYKIRVYGEQRDLRDLIDKIGNICSRPFVPRDKEYNWAFYVYNVDPQVKEKIVKILDESMEASKPSVSKVEVSEEIRKEEVSVEPKKAKAKKPIKPIGELKLNPAYTFENFVVGPSNRFTHAATQAVAKSPGEIYNPLFIYGGVGLGKTHLLHAIGHYVKSKKSSAKIFYVTTETFMNEVIEAIGKGTIEEFRECYRQVDLLLIDDIQFLVEAESTQEEFFHTFNVLHDAHKQIVISSDKPPKQLTTLEERLKSRFEWGLIADIKSPNLETRVAILKKKEEIENLDLSDNILVYIAGKLKSNIRELEGFLKRINAYGQLTKQEVTIDLVRELMNDLLPEKEREEFVEVKPPEKKEPELEEGKKTAPPPLEVEEERKCLTCGQNLAYVEQYDRWYCHNCKKYAPKEIPGMVAPEVSPPEEEVIKEEVEEIKRERVPPPTEEKEVKAAKEPEPAPQVSPPPVESAPVDKALRKVEVCYFYPQDRNKEFKELKTQFEEVLKKHKLKFRLEAVFEKEYKAEKKINYGMFAELCKTGNVRIAVVLGPPLGSSLLADEFSRMLGAILDDSNISLHFIPYSDIKKRYKYLNMLLDIAVIGHKELFPK
ncbi:Chromosomal replication initiator protein DnaA [subsurface metagenome]